MCVYYSTVAALVTVSIAAGLLVMVSSELVVLLIVCVGINIGSAMQEPGQPGEPVIVITVSYNTFHRTLSKSWIV